MANGFKWYPQGLRGVRADLAGALERTAADIVADLEARRVVPHAPSASKPGHEAGRLAASVSVDATRARQGSVRITWDAPFAARAYFHPEWKFTRDVHSEAKGRWMDDYMPGGILSDYAQRRYRHHLGLGRWFR